MPPPRRARVTARADAVSSAHASSSSAQAKRLMASSGFWRRLASEMRRSAGSMTRVAIVIAAVKTHVVDVTLCVGPSMMPTFNPRGDVVLVERLSARGTPRRGDVVLAVSPTNPTQLVFKRAVGVGGDIVEVPYSRGANFRLTRRRVRVPEGTVWLQGDNARNSTDSREYGPVPEEMLRGSAVVRIWPPSGFGWVRNSMQDAVLVRSASSNI